MFTLVSSCALARLSTAIAKNTLSKVSVHSRVKEYHINASLGYVKIKRNSTSACNNFCLDTVAEECKNNEED